jgi:hypothetical protein
MVKQIEEHPLGAILTSNKKTIGFDPASGKRVYLSKKKLKRKTNIFVPNPSKEIEGQLNGWLLSIMRNKLITPIGEYDNLKARKKERKYIKHIHSVARKETKKMKEHTPNAMFAKGEAQMVALARLAADYDPEN